MGASVGWLFFFLFRLVRSAEEHYVVLTALSDIQENESAPPQPNQDILNKRLSFGRQQQQQQGG